MTAHEPALPRPSHADLAYQTVRDLLLRLEIPPGAPIIEADLMARTGFGRTPLREALNRLEGDQLVNIYPRRGTFAADIKLADLSLITDLREELEGHAAARAAQRATPPERASLSALAASIGDGDAETQMSLDTDIHREIYRSAHNHFLEETATQYHNLSMRIWRLFTDQLPNIDRHVEQHRALLKAIVRGDAENARELARAHVRSFESTVQALL